jgi:hypothetical protein
MRVLHAAVAFAVLAGLAEVGEAQSLGELAAKEKAKRQGKPAPKVITEGELSRAGKRGTVSMTGEAPAEGGETVTEGTTTEGGAGAGGTGAPAKPSNAPKEKTEDELRAERRTQWQKEYDLAKEKVRVHSLNVSNLQKDLDDVTGGIYTERRNQSLANFNREKAALAAAEAELSRLDEEGRRNAWPRG